MMGRCRIGPGVPAGPAPPRPACLSPRRARPPRSPPLADRLCDSRAPRRGRGAIRSASGWRRASRAPDGFVLWTRLAPVPLWDDPAAPGGLTAGDVTLTYEIAADPGMRTIVQSGPAVAEAAYAYSVHLEVGGSPRSGRTGTDSPRGTRRAASVAPGPGPSPAPPRGSSGSRSCPAPTTSTASSRPTGTWPTNSRIWCSSSATTSTSTCDRVRPTVRRHSDDVEAATLPHLSQPLRAVPLDPDLQRLHAEAPALATWDDHEVQNDYASDGRRRSTIRRASARGGPPPTRPSTSTCRSGRAGRGPRAPRSGCTTGSRFGDLLEFSTLDGRQYRSREACTRAPDYGGGHFETDALCPERRDPGRSLLGIAQEAWLFDGLARASARWNVLAQDVLMAQLRQRVPLAGILGFWTDAWDGYPVSRSRLLRQIEASRVPNPVVSAGTFTPSGSTISSATSTIPAPRPWRRNSSGRPSRRRAVLLAVHGLDARQPARAFSRAASAATSPSSSRPSG